MTEGPEQPEGSQGPEGSDRPEGSQGPEGSDRRDDEPDVRFSYANERTFLAWNRTALALIATGVAATQLLPRLQVTWGRRLLGLPLIALGAVVAAESFRQFRSNHRAMQQGRPLPRSIMPLILTVGITLIGLLAVVIAAIGSR